MAEPRRWPVETPQERFVFRPASDGLAALNEIDDIPELMRRAPAALCTTATFWRAAIWRVKGEHLIRHAVAAARPAAASPPGTGRGCAPRSLEASSAEADAIRGGGVVLSRPRSGAWRSSHAEEAYMTTAIDVGQRSLWLLQANPVPGDRLFEQAAADCLWQLAERLRVISRLAVLEQQQATIGDLIQSFAEEATGRRPLLPAQVPDDGLTEPVALAAQAFHTRVTAREREVAELLAAGLSNPVIARRLTVAEATVKSHVRSLLRKLGASNRIEAITVLHEHGVETVRDSSTPQAGPVLSEARF